MMAKILPVDAIRSAVYFSIPLSRATTRATSELNGSIVAAKKAEKKRAISGMLYSL